MKTVTISTRNGTNHEVILSDKDYKKVKNLPLGVKPRSGNDRRLIPYIRIKDGDEYKQYQLSTYLFIPENMNENSIPRRRVRMKDGNLFNLSRSNVQLL